jgi:glycosyltransferase involved in cell wall biosynthesis
VKNHRIIFGGGNMENETKCIQYSIVIPVYNSEKTLVELTERILKTMQTLATDFEILFIDDCSKDRSWDVLKDLRKTDFRIKIFHLSKNSGQHNAILCGLNYASGNYIIVMDDDLQNPPEEIPKLIKKVGEGYSVVYGKYISKKHGITKNLLGLIYHSVFHYILDVPKDLTVSNFIIMSSDVQKNILKIKCSFTFINGLISKVTPPEKMANVDVIHESRTFGRSNYTRLKHMKLLLNLIINYSSFPLVSIGILGAVTSILSTVYGLFLVVNRLINPNFGVDGWLSLMVAISILGGLILMSIAVVGEYVRRILTEITYTQPYLIEEMEL